MVTDEDASYDAAARTVDKEQQEAPPLHKEHEEEEHNKQPPAAPVATRPCHRHHHHRKPYSPSYVWFLTDPSLYEYYECDEDAIGNEKIYGKLNVRDVTRVYINEERRGQHKGKASLRRHHMAGRLSPLDICAPSTVEMFSTIKEHFLPLGFLDACSFSRFRDSILAAGSVDGYDTHPSTATDRSSHLRK